MVKFSRQDDGSLKIDYELNNSKLPKAPSLNLLQRIGVWGLPLPTPVSLPLKAGPELEAGHRLGPAISGNVQIRRQGAGVAAQERADNYPAREAWHFPGRGVAPDKLYTHTPGWGGPMLQLFPGPQGS